MQKKRFKYVELCVCVLVCLFGTKVKVAKIPATTTKKWYGKESYINMQIFANTLV